VWGFSYTKEGTIEQWRKELGDSIQFFQRVYRGPGLVNRIWSNLLLFPWLFDVIMGVVEEKTLDKCIISRIVNTPRA